MRLMLTGTMLSLLVAALAAPAAASPVSPDGRERGVVGWIDRTAAPLATTEPNAPPDDLRPLRGVVGGAQVVGLGESTHGSREQFRIKHRIVRFLVERMGFRTVAVEDDFASGVELDHYVLTGQGDPRGLVADMSSPYWATEEILELVRWLRSYNQTHADKVRFLGTDVTHLRQRSFDELTGYVREVAPQRLAELAGYLEPIRPAGSRLEHLVAYLGLSPAEKQPLIDRARQAYRLVRDLPDTGSRNLAREFAEQHARAIVGWHESHANEGVLTERETYMADTVTWWQRTVGGKVAYWAASVHTAAAPAATITLPGATETGVWAGGHLRERLGRRYVSIGLVFGSGTVTSGIPPRGPAPHPIGPAPAHMTDATLDTARAGDYLLDLRAPAPAAVRAWLTGPATLRMVHPRYVAGEDPGAYSMSVPALTGAFDALVHVRTTTASRLLG